MRLVYVDGIANQYVADWASIPAAFAVSVVASLWSSLRQFGARG
jgi:hypothetical protein